MARLDCWHGERKDIGQSRQGQTGMAANAFQRMAERERHQTRGDETVTLRQREPRVKDNKHLDYIRSLPCCICGGIDTEAAHIRTASLEHGKQHTGMGEKPSDKWAVPL